jgi:8-oxo-dGTP pyrophosphatase MutT (NUDIX family)
LTAGCRVEKSRYILPWQDLNVEVDIYDGALDSLRVAEIEFATQEDSETFVKPPFLGPEVTGRPEYSNASLAAHGLPGVPSSQIGCVPFVRKGKDLHVVLVRNSSGQRWIVPKGQPENGMTPPEVALMEAVEEGGAVGHIEPSLQSVCQLEDGRSLRLYAMRVSTVLKRWPEAGFRKRSIVPWQEAVALIEDKSLSQTVEELALRFLREI